MDSNRQQITEILAKLRHNANVLVSTVVLETQAKLKEQSPVDTGRFRGNWLISEDELDDTTYPDGQEAPPYTLEITADKTYYITNSLPYAQRLAEGWSRQAPAGWVELIAAGIPNRAEQIARALDGNS
jgi:hypothetical protein